ncbi:MAG: hypothetical protein ACREMY_00095 [bacterium]
MSTWTVLRLAVFGLIVLGMVTIISVAVLIWTGSAVPDGLTAIAGTAVGALATLMVTHDRRPED